jgi:hypothetical protein
VRKPSVAATRKLSCRVSSETAKRLAVHAALSREAYGEVIERALRPFLRERGMGRELFNDGTVAGRIGPEEDSGPRAA